MPTPDGVWTEYVPANSTDPDHVQGDTIVRAFSSEIAALRSATANGNRAVYVQWGETIEEALFRAFPPGPRKADTPAPKRRTAAERMAARLTEGGVNVTAPLDDEPNKEPA